jgi:hypothetical protein
MKRNEQSHRKLHAAKAIAEAGLNALALVSLVRWVGPRRLARVAALATEGYVGRRRSRRN